MALVALPVFVLGVLAALLLRDAVQVARTLQAVADDMFAARSALAQGDIEQAETLLEGARGELRSSNTVMNRPLWRAFERVPVLSRSLVTGRLLNDAADQAARVGLRLMDHRDVVLDEQGRLRITLEDGKLSLPPLVAAREAIESVDLAPFRAATDALGTSPATWMPAEVREARTEALELAREVLRTLDASMASLDVLHSFAGGEGPRQYLLAMQNPAELRGTGGLIGFFSLVTAVDGEFTLSDPLTYDVLEESGPFAAQVDLGRDTEFDRRYGRADGRGFAANVNLDGDLPTVGPILSTLAGSGLGVDFDGVILIDPVGLARALEDIGPVDVDDAFVDTTGSIPDPLPADQIPDVTMKRAYDVFGGESEARDDYLRELATAAFDMLFAGDWDPIPISRDLAAVALTRHLQLWSEHSDEQDAFEFLRVAGALADPSGEDFVAVAGVNAAANKLDVYAHRQIEVDVHLNGDDADADRVATVAVGLENQAPAEQLDDYVAGSGAFDPAARFAVRDGPHGLNRTWFTVWNPADATVLRVENAEQELTTSLVTPLGLGVAVDKSMALLPREEDRFSVYASAPAMLQRDGPDLVYSLWLRRQPSAVPDEVSVTIHAPGGWGIAEVEAVQTADPLLPAATELGVDIAGDRATATGLVDADVRVRVRFTRSLQSRLGTWLDELW